MSLLQLFRAKRSFPSSYLPSMPALPSRPSLDRLQIERAMERGRARMGALADIMTAEHMAELIDDLRDEAAPMIERVLPMIERAARRRRRGRGRKLAMATLGIMGLAGIAGIVAYLFWPRRDEEPAHLMDAPEAPHVAPAGTPPTKSPTDGPTSSPNGDVCAGAVPTELPIDVRSDRELAGTTGFRDERDAREPSDERACAVRVIAHPVAGQLASNVAASITSRGLPIDAARR